MTKEKKAPPIPYLWQLKQGTTFKVPVSQKVDESMALSLDGVYRVHKARANRGSHVVIHDLRKTRQADFYGIGRFRGWIAPEKDMSVAAELAKRIEVYTLP